MCLRSLVLLSELLQAQHGQKEGLKNQNSNSSPFITVLSYSYVIYSASTHTQAMHDHSALVNKVYASTNINDIYIENSNNDRISHRNNNSYDRFQKHNTESDHDSCSNDSVKHHLNINLNTINGNHNDDTNSIKTILFLFCFDMLLIVCLFYINIGFA